MTNKSQNLHFRFTADEKKRLLEDVKIEHYDNLTELVRHVVLMHVDNVLGTKETNKND